MDDLNNICTNVIDANAAHFKPFSACPIVQHFSPLTPSSDHRTIVASKFNSQEFLSFQQNPRKKRSKLIKTGNPNGVRSNCGVWKPKFSKKPDPCAPKITSPCAVCGRRFWSWKALFGHMRCHPERQWRGINPPPNFRRQDAEASTSSYFSDESDMSKEEHAVAAYLLLLGNGPITCLGPETGSDSPTITTVGNQVESDGANVVRNPLDSDGGGCRASCSRFECSSCKKVFGSHQALGGHRASHKNARGCFASTRTDDLENDLTGDHSRRVDSTYNVERAGVNVEFDDEVVQENEGREDKMVVSVSGHQCSICFRVFSSGQALGGHKRCHWEKGEETLPLIALASKELSAWDLNIPPPMDDDSSCSYSSLMGLDLRLRL